MHHEYVNEMFMVARQPCSLVSIHGNYEPSMTGEYNFGRSCGRAKPNSPQYEEVSNKLRIPTSAQLLAKYGILQNGGGWPQIEDVVSLEASIHQCNEVQMLIWTLMWQSEMKFATIQGSEQQLMNTNEYSIACKIWNPAKWWCMATD